MNVDDLIPQERNPRADPRVGDVFRDDDSSFRVDAWGRRLAEHEVTRSEKGRVHTWWCRLDNRTRGDKPPEGATHARIVRYSKVEVNVIGGEAKTKKLTMEAGQKWVPIARLMKETAAAASVLAHDSERWWERYAKLGAIDAHQATETSPMVIVMTWGVITRSREDYKWRLSFATKKRNIKVGPFRSFDEARIYGLAWQHMRADKALYDELHPGYRRAGGEG